MKYQPFSSACGGGFFAVIVAGQHTIAAQGDFADVAFRQIAAFGVHDANLGVRDRAATGYHRAIVGPFAPSDGCAIRCSMMVLRSITSTVGGCVDVALRDGERVLGHRVTGLQRRRIQAVSGEFFGKGEVAVVAHRLGAVDHGAQAGQVQPSRARTGGCGSPGSCRRNWAASTASPGAREWLAAARTDRAPSGTATSARDGRPGSMGMINPRSGPCRDRAGASSRSRHPA